MDWLVRFIQIACWIEIISMHVNAQQALSLKRFHGPDWQNWDELDLQTRLFSRLDATWVAQGRFSSHPSNPAVGVLGADFNFEVSKYLVITPSYYCFTFRTAAGVEGHGQDPILAATVFARYGALTISDRNRFIGALGITGTQDFGSMEIGRGSTTRSVLTPGRLRYLRGTKSSISQTTTVG
jgi:hypothetical protein